MKTLILITICAVVSGATVHAQVDTSRNRTGVRPVQPVQPAQPVQPVQPTQPVQPQVLPQTQPLTQPSAQPMGLPTPQQPATSPGSPAGWNPVNNQTIPDNLRQTLSTPQYQGWENGSMYQNPNNGMYQLRTNDSNNNQQVYYFDKDGKLTTAPPHD